VLDEPLDPAGRRRAGRNGGPEMQDFKIGDIVQITGSVMSGNVGTVVSIDEKREKYLVRISDVTQNYFASDELKRFSS
jgi:transcription antitermination factor NusG